MGKPTHVFDMDLLEGGKIIVRKARDGEKLKTLDGVERKLTSEDLVVCDAKKPVGLAGVMGGYDTMITEKTRNIVIESAWWDPGIVRKMSRRHGIHTDASHRFERGADFESTVLSCDLVAQMILQSGGGELVGDVVDVVSKTYGSGAGGAACRRGAADFGRKARFGRDFSHAEAAWVHVDSRRAGATRSFACKFRAGGWMWSARSM